MMMGYGGGMGWAGWLMMGFTFLLFWGVVIALVVWLIQSFRAPVGRGAAAPTGRADEVLAERFARGEIDADEYARRRDVLRGANP
jgi:putative membrane protein